MTTMANEDNSIPLIHPVVKWVAALVLLCACSRGNLGDDCNPDGSCNSPHLACSGLTCQIKPEPKTCTSDADCFCERCMARCGTAGIKVCAFTDVSVWGSKPTVCECRTEAR